MRHAPGHLTAPEGRGPRPGECGSSSGDSHTTDGCWGCRVKPSLSVGSPTFSASSPRTGRGRIALRKGDRMRHWSCHPHAGGEPSFQPCAPCQVKATCARSLRVCSWAGPGPGRAGGQPLLGRVPCGWPCWMSRSPPGPAGAGRPTPSPCWSVTVSEPLQALLWQSSAHR